MKKRKLFINFLKKQSLVPMGISSYSSVPKVILGRIQEGRTSEKGNLFFNFLKKQNSGTRVCSNFSVADPSQI